MELAVGLVIADRFRLVRPLGQGGMGAVWLADHTGLDVPCAVKFIHEEAARSPELRARFEREAKAAAQLRSPHVVQILDHGVWQGAPYIAMEYLEGEDLGQRLQRRGALSHSETLAVAVQVGRALARAHGTGLVHRDLKPSNIFLVRDDEREIAKVLDFGVAKVKETGLDGCTKTGAMLGTPYYMSPEQARGSKGIDHRSDLWALAVVTYQCVTGRLPFMGEALGDLFVKIIIEPLPVPSQVARVPPGFDAWWLRAAARDPGQRFQTAKELSEALGLALGVTVPGGVDVGMTAPGQDTIPMEPSPLQRSQGGTIALTPSGPMTPPLAMLPSPQAGPTTPLPSALTPPGVSTPTPQGPWPNAPASGHEAIHARPATPSGRAGAVAAAIATALVLGGLGAFFAFRGGPPAAAPRALAASSASAAPAAAPSPAVSAATRPSAADAETAAAPPASSPIPSASASPAASHAVGAKPAGRPKHKTDFGF